MAPKEQADGFVKPEDITAHLGARMPVRLVRQFQAFAKRQDRSVSAELRRAVEAHLERNGKGAA